MTQPVTPSEGTPSTGPQTASAADEAQRQIAALHRVGLQYGLIPSPATGGPDEIDRFRPRRSARAAKRGLDIALGTLLAVLAIPVVALSAVVVAVSLQTQPFFFQRRIGELGREFTILKIRTLPRSVPSYGNKHELHVDEMPLPFFARLLRRTHLDELPQLFLVPLGRMSLVGPRPCQPVSVEPVSPHVELMRTAIPQGCTGVWQISSDSGGLASGAPELDEFYLRHASLRLDVWILARTVGYVLGMAKPITTRDIPRWVLGRGLVADPAGDVYAIPDARVSPPNGNLRASEAVAD